MSSSLNLETATTSGNSLSSTYSKMEHLPIGESGVALVTSSQSSSISNGNVHCSIGQQSGTGGGLAPIMEIREMNSYCNSCVTVGAADKYWNHHHPHANVTRHTSVYPQMFYTPPPPPLSAPPTQAAVNYSTPSVPPPPPPNEWSCPTASAESYSHFIYSQYPPPPPSQHHDYNNFLNISTSCYESDLMLMGAVSGPSSQQNNCESSVPVPTQAMMNSFMYSAPLPPQLSSFESVINSIQMSSSTIGQQISPSTKAAERERFPVPPTTPTASSSSAASSTSEDSTDESNVDDDESSHIISIEDDDNDKMIDDEHLSSSSAPDVSSPLPLCILCKKTASLLPSQPPNAPSPQLSRILDNIDDDELDISVCSGDIEIGGIEDEMIQHVTEQQQQKVSLQRLSQLIGVPLMELTSCHRGGNLEKFSINQDALLCSKCQKLVGLAESLEKQLTSVLCTLRQALSLEDNFTTPLGVKIFPEQVNSIGIQTEDYNLVLQNDHILVRPINSKTYNQHYHNDQEKISTRPEKGHKIEAVRDDDTIKTFGQYLCHICGRHFNCKRNLGKHFKRHHYSQVFSVEKRLKVVTCPRENCGKTCPDKSALQVHLRKHTSEKPYFCVSCLKLFTTKSNLTAHIKSGVCHEKTESTLSIEHVSSVASPSSPNRTSGDDNANNTKNIPFHCDNCGLGFRVKSRFQKHLSNSKSCNKAKLFQCDVCSKPFAKRSELHAHHPVHTGQKSFICDICGMTFSTRGNQRVHQRTHFNLKRFKCQQCNKGFTRNQTLQIHIANVHT